MPDARDLLATYRESVRGLRRGAGPAGALFKPLEVTADVLDQVLNRQSAMEAQLGEARQSLDALQKLTLDAPGALRAQAKAFSSAAESFEQAAKVMNLQADLLERTNAALKIPGRVAQSVRPRRPRSSG